jgi:N-methylhydantoinase A
MSAAEPAQARLAIDIGGTFTDVVIAHAERYWTTKVLTTREAPEQGVIAAIRAALDHAGLKPTDIGVVIHGTTLATNALIERNGARTALLTTEGFRDTIELGTESRFDQYDVNLVKQPPLIPRNRRIPIVERIAADGEILTPLDEQSVIDAIARLRAESIESVAVGFLHSYVQPAHELRVRAVLREHVPHMLVSLSSEVSAEMREFERFSTTCANAYVQPLIAGYLGRLRDSLKMEGFACELLLMLSSGGITTVDTACAFPIRLVESGPAGGAIFAQHIARRHDATRVISFDMGGTTAKICLIDDFKPQTSRVFEIDRSSRFRKGSGIPVRIPVIEMVEIGAGGGSTARVDGVGRIAVGPDSAGSLPGPVCYGRGGTEPTVTDADVVLSRIDPAAFAGGQLSIDLQAAQLAIERTATASGLDLGTEGFAYGIIELVDEAMANAARVHAAEIGKTLPERTLIAFGGAAPLHVARVADKLGISRIIVPADAGVGSAVGFLLAPISHEIARSLYTRLQQFRAGPINAMLDAMAAAARRVAGAGAQGRPLSEERTAFARYVGQGHEIPIMLPVRALADGDRGALRGAFEQAYARQYHRLIEGVDIEILTWTVTVGTTAPGVVPMPSVAAGAAAGLCARRRVFDPGAAARLETAIYPRSALSRGSAVAGPAIITEDATSTVLGPHHHAEISADGSIVITRVETA